MTTTSPDRGTNHKETTMTTTYSDVLGRHSVEIPGHLEAQAEVPVCTGPQRQGDLIVLPSRPGVELGALVPASGVPVVRGEAGGNTHLLVADGPVSWLAGPVSDRLHLGTVTVPEGATAFLLHPEHGAQGIGPGSYRVRRQREQADEIRMVAD